MVYHCQQVLIKTESQLKAILEFICSEANKLINCGIYLCRQLFFKARKFLTGYDLDKELKSNLHFQALRSCAAQQALHKVADSFKSYKKLFQLYLNGEIKERPQPPKYRKKGGFAPVVYPARFLKLTSGGIRFSLGRLVKTWFNLDCFYLKMPSNLNFSALKEVRILPRNNCFYAEFITNDEPRKVNLEYQNVLGIDPGLNNWLTCVSNLGKSFIVDGKKVKAQNQWYNKQVAKLKSGKTQGYWDDDLAAITEKRNRQMRDNVNKAARLIINWCLKNNVGTIVFGWNQRNKDSINIGRKNNQEFVQVPTAKLKSRIEDLCSEIGIQFIETEESYTSKSSYLDGDIIPKYGEKPNDWKPSGKRVKRGLYKDAKGQLINADCNGAANILRKVATQLTINLAKVGRAFLTVPKRYDLTSLRKSYRQNGETRFQPVSS